MFDALVRLLSSSTFWAALIALVTDIVSTLHGVPLPGVVVAAMPLAVGFKEASRRLADAQTWSSDNALQQAIVESDDDGEPVDETEATLTDTAMREQVSRFARR